MVTNAQQAAILEEVTEHIRRLHFDVRAEVVVGELQDNHLQPQDIVVEMANSFSRSFSRDILHAELDERQVYHPYVVLSLSRDGLYDRLPEGIFHPFTPQRQQPTVKEMVENYKRQQEQERQARRFFQPIEHEFFQQRVFLEQREKHLLFEAFGKDADQLFLSFWHIDATLPQPAVNKLVRLLPYMYRIAGNIALVRQCLQVMLEEPVDICWDRSPQVVEGDAGVALGDCRLGVDTMVGETFYSDMAKLRVTIGPIQQRRIYDYLPWQSYGRLLSVAYGFLFAADVEVETVLLPHEREKEVVMDDSVRQQGLMGYNFYL